MMNPPTGDDVAAASLAVALRSPVNSSTLPAGMVTCVSQGESERKREIFKPGLLRYELYYKFTRTLFTFFFLCGVRLPLPLTQYSHHSLCGRCVASCSSLSLCVCAPQ